MDATPPRATMFGRALRRRCPVCGTGGLFTRWLQMRPACPGCGLHFARGEDGYTLGALWFNMLFAEGVNTVLWVTVAITTWPDVPWELLHWVGPTMAVLLPLFFYPFARLLFLSFDLCFRPLERPAAARR